jgi:hypothetical protein
MEFEQKHQRLAPFGVFLRRWLRYIGFSAVMLTGALAIGVGGYHWVAGLGWVDSLLNASMILGGMGPVDELKTRAAKLFAAFYALFSGLVFVLLMGIVLAPLAHRMLHKFHLAEEDLGE